MHAQHIDIYQLCVFLCVFWEREIDRKRERDSERERYAHTFSVLLLSLSCMQLKWKLSERSQDNPMNTSGPVRRPKNFLNAQWSLVNGPRV
jgi:hypothetical protein